MLFSKKNTGIPIQFLGLPVVILEDNGTILDINDYFLELLSKEKDSVIGLHYRDIEYFRPIEQHITRTISKQVSYIHKHNIGDKYFEVTITPLRIDSKVYFSMYFYDISPYLMLEKDLIKRNRELMTINTLSGAFISSENIEGVFSDLLEKTMLITDFTTGYIVVRTNLGYELKSSIGISRSFQSLLIDGRMNDFFDTLWSLHDPLYVFEEDELRGNPLFNEEGIFFLTAIPIRISKRVIGMTFLASRTQRILDFDLASILSLIGTQLSLIVEKIELFDETRRLSITDSLTGLYNSRYFYQELDKEIARSSRYRLSFSLAIFDIDDFKVINDTYGHQTGDEILIHIASVLRLESRETDIVARYGGEEFVIIFPNTSKKEALAVSERILHNLNRNMVQTGNGHMIHITMSGGIAAFPSDAVSSHDLLHFSDIAMYKAKSAGKKQIVCYNKRHENNI